MEADIKLLLLANIANGKAAPAVEHACPRSVKV